MVLFDHLFSLQLFINVFVGEFFHVHLFLYVLHRLFFFLLLPFDDSLQIIEETVDLVLFIDELFVLFQSKIAKDTHTLLDLESSCLCSVLVPEVGEEGVAGPFQVVLFSKGLENID